MLFLQPSSASKSLSTKPLGHNQLSVCSYKQLCLWCSFVVLQLMLIGKICSKASFMLCVVSIIFILQKTVAQNTF